MKLSPFILALLLTTTAQAETNQAVLEHVKSLGGRVRWVSAKRESLEVDFEFSGDKVTDETLARLAELGPIEALRLKKTGLTDAGLQHVARLAGLRRLYLEHTAVTNAGLKHRAGLKQLEYLNLYQAQATDEGLLELAPLLPALKEVYFHPRQVSAATIDKISKKLPGLRVWPRPERERARVEAVLKLSEANLSDAESEWKVCLLYTSDAADE